MDEICLISRELRMKIAREIRKRIPNLRCPMCGSERMDVESGFIHNHLTTQKLEPRLFGVSIPSIPLVCQNCGFISQHALGILSVLDKDKGDWINNDETVSL